MIKLFLITLLCMAMFADSQQDRRNEMGTGLRKTSADMAEHAMTGQGSPLLMQHVAHSGRGPPGQGPSGQGPPGQGQQGQRPRGPPPESQESQEEEEEK